MSIVPKPMAMSFLRWSLSLVVLGEACRSAVCDCSSPPAGHGVTGMDRAWAPRTEEP